MISANGKSTLERLSAADKYLWRGEQLVIWRFVVCVVLPVLLSVGRIWLAASAFYCNALVLCCAGASLAWVIFEAKIATDRRQGARMLQVAECELYGIRWNRYLCGEEPLPEDVYTNRRLGLENYKDRYQDAATQNAAFLLNIQQMSRIYAANRKKHLNICKWIFGITITLVVVSSTLDYNMNLNGFLYYAVLPCVPIVVWYHAIISSYKRSGAQLGLMTMANSADIGQEKESNRNEMIQDCVFIYRNNACLVPRFVGAKR